MLLIQKELRSHREPKRAEDVMRFFKTGKGEYGEGDIFLGLTVPLTREIVKKYRNMKRKDTLKLLTSKFHEERLAALFILIAQYEKTKDATIIKDYLAHTEYINNWDLVDTSAYKLLGIYLRDTVKDREKIFKILTKLAKSKSLWEQRIAVVTTFAFIQKHEGSYTYAMADILLSHKHDLIHKAVGWMLRECGKKVSELELIKYLNVNEKKMSRTTWRYARERLGRDM